MGDREGSCCPPRPDHTPAPSGLALAFQDGSVHVVHRLSLQTMAVLYSSAPRSLDEPALKRPRTTGPAIHFKAMQLSWTSLALVGIDNHGKVSAQTRRVEGVVGKGWGGQVEGGGMGRQCPSAQPPPQLSMLRISPSLGHPLEPKLALQHLLFLLEYCMVTGYDWWDILLHVQPGMVQSLVERLHEEYTRQKPALQQVGVAPQTRKRPSYCLPSVGCGLGPGPSRHPAAPFGDPGE